MNKRKYPSFKLVAILVVIAAIAAAVVGVNRMTELPLDRAAGGTYVGELPGFGKIQFDLFLGSPWSTSWLHREDFGEIGYAAVSTNASGEFRVDLLKDHDDATNATLVFKLTADGTAMKGVAFTAADFAPKPFELTRLYRYFNIHKHAGGMLGRLGVYADASCQIPMLAPSSAFASALKQILAKEAGKNVRGFTTGNLQRQWEILRYGAIWTAHQETLWQVRLLSDKIASFAMWKYSNPGGANGNLTSWEGRNFYWRDGRIHELKLSVLFQSGVEWKSEVRRLCCEDLERQQYISESRAVLEEDISEDQFTVSSTGMQIYFNPYSLAAGANGEYIVHIPYKLLLPYLRPEWLAALAPPLALR